jgi:hypothetical protein
MKIDCDECNQKIDANKVILKASKLPIWLGRCEKCKVVSWKPTDKLMKLILSNMADEFHKQKKIYEKSENSGILCL